MKENAFYSEADFINSFIVFEKHTSSFKLCYKISCQTAQFSDCFLFALCGLNVFCVLDFPHSDFVRDAACEMGRVR